MFKIINENVEELEALAVKPTVEKVKLSEIRQEQQNDENKKLGEILAAYTELSEEEKRHVLVGIFDDNDENK